jgi:hypothetical protein
MLIFLTKIFFLIPVVPFESLRAFVFILLEVV